MLKRNYVSVLSKAITHYLYKEFLQVLEHYLSFSRRTKLTPISFHKLQQWILHDILEYQGGTAHHKQRKAELHEMLRSEPDSERKQKLVDDLQESNTHQLIYKLMLRNVREIVDGMVWRLFDYKRGWLNVYASTKQNMNIQLSKGLEIELSELAEYSYYGRIALLNDLTSLIDVGDITVKNADGKFEFHEIKGSRKITQRTLRQKEKHQRAVDFVNKGHYEEDGHLYRLVDLNISYDNYLRPVLNIVKEARNKGYGANVLSKYLIVECSYADQLTDKDAVQRVNEKSRKIRKCWSPKEKVSIVSNIFRLRYYPRLYAPYSIFPYPEDICLDLISGRAMLFAHMNFSQILAILKKKLAGLGGNSLRFFVGWAEILLSFDSWSRSI